MRRSWQYLQHFPRGCNARTAKVHADMQMFLLDHGYSAQEHDEWGTWYANPPVGTERWHFLHHYAPTDHSHIAALHATLQKVLVDRGYDAHSADEFGVWYSSSPSPAPSW
tara:strand:- start:903 stop:1232 length:330 start_codon:yes stop_codon:yes gene_type:complete